MMNTAMTALAMGRLSASPPSFSGLSRKSPTVAPSGRVWMKAAQNSRTRDRLVQKYAAAMIASAARFTTVKSFPAYLQDDVYATGEPRPVAA